MSDKYQVKVKECRLRVSDSFETPYEKIAAPHHAASVFRQVMHGLPHEEMWVLMLTGDNRPLGLVKVSQGGIGGAAVQPSDVLRPAIVAGARAFILAHNHPSGDSTPSPDDIQTTRTLTDCARMLGITMLDHLVLTDDSHTPISDLLEF